MYKTCKFCGSQVNLINKTHNLVECLNCYLIFSKKIYTQEELSELYEKLYHDENPKYKNHSIKEYEELKKGIFKIGYNKKRLIRKYVRKNSKILEIGSGVGLMGCYLKNKYPETLYTGIEIDYKINEKARSLGLDVHNGDFSLLNQFEESYDLIFMWEVLEHIQNLKKCLSLIKARLSKGGLFIFSVPNYDKRKNYINAGDNIYTSPPPIHLNFFQKKSIYQIFQFQGFNVLSFKKKKMPYLKNILSASQIWKIITGQFEGPTLYCVIRRNDE